jgi:hypothetical protein
MRTLYARELGELLFQVRGSFHPGSNAKLKTAAIAMARAPEQERRNVIAAYSWAYCEHAYFPDVARTSGVYLLLRLLFVVEGRDALVAHVDPSGHFFDIEPSGRATWPPYFYSALGEYNYFAAHFRRRTVAEIEALEIR